MFLDGHLWRELAPQVLGTVVRHARDFAVAEDAVQEALLAAATQWPSEGLPENPRAWLTQVALRRLTDEIRRDVARRRREAAAALETGYVIPADDPADGSEQQDDTLRLIYLCCHPAITNASAIALTLRAVGGLTTAEIARAFLVPEATMAQRITRAKQTIKDSAIPFRLPTKTEEDERTRAVLHILYLIFNEGYTASSGETLQRNDLASEAIRLTRLMHRLKPGQAEVAGLLALMLLTDARRASRTGESEEPVPLDRQDRSLWDRQQIVEGVALLSETLPRGAIGPYQIQAAIAALHDEAPTAAETDWRQILALYKMLRLMSRNPIVELNHAVATAMVEGPAAGLALLRPLEAEGSLRGHHRLDAVRGHLQEMAGDDAAAIESYLSAAAKTASLPERTYLLSQAARLRG